MAPSSEVSKNFSNLQITTDGSKKPSKSKKAGEEIADSWEDAPLTPSDEEDGSSTETERETDLQPLPSNESPAVPPPTPSSPTSHTFPYSHPTIPFPSPRNGSSPRPIRPDRDEVKTERRPEKSAAAASRMIAGALGVRPPKMSAEQREYERVVRERERKRREGEKERVREEERRRAAVWED